MTEHFLESHNSARWEERKENNKEDPTWAPLSKGTVQENPLNEIVKDIAKQKVFQKETDLEEVRLSIKVL